MSLELLLLLDVDESSDDEELEESSLLEDSESSEEEVGFLRFFFFSSGLAATLLLSASLGSSSEAPRKRGLYCMPSESIQSGNMNRMHARRFQCSVQHCMAITSQQQSRLTELDVSRGSACRLHECLM